MGDVPAWRSAAAQVLVADLADPALDPDDLHHLGRVLRLRPGAEVCATDGAGGWRPTRFTGSERLDPSAAASRETPPTYQVAVGFALVKGERPELVVQKLTELGVDRIVLFGARRSVVRWDDDRAAKHLTRLQRVAREACGQCRRLWLPTVELASLAELTAPGVVCADAGGRPLGDGDRMVLVGPEGGWDDGEVGGRDAVALGPNVLRAETAAIAAGTLLAALRDGLTAVSTTSHRTCSYDDRQ